MESISILIYLAVLIVFLTLRWKKWSVKKIECKEYVDKNKIFEGEEFNLILAVSNKKILPLPWVRILLQIPESIKDKDERSKYKEFIEIHKKNTVTSLFSYQRVRITNRIKCNRMGYYPLPDVRISMGDYIGLTKGELDFNIPRAITVYPKIEPLEQLIALNTSLQGDISVKRWIIPDPMDVIGNREYTSRDSFNTIDWKASAKTGKLYVKQFDFTSDPSLMVFLDVQTQENYTWGYVDENIQKGIRLAASIVDKAIKEKIPVGYSTNAYLLGNKYTFFIKPRCDNKQKGLILDALTRTKNSRRIPFGVLVNDKIKLLEKNDTLIFLISYISNDLKEQINYYSKIGYNIKLILLGKDVSTEGISRNVEIAKSTR